MENVKIISDSGIETSVNGIFYIFDSKYYFMYTTCEMEDNDYVKLYVVQVCKEVKNTSTGPIDTGYMLGIEISNPEEWTKVQQSITKIVEDKKNGTKSNEIQYLPMNMLVNLKVVSKNKFKLMKQIVEENFGVTLLSEIVNNNAENEEISLPDNLENNVDSQSYQSIEPLQSVESNVDFDQYSSNVDNADNTESTDDVIIDYRTRFFEEQQKNEELEEQIKILNEKLENIKNIIG